MKDLGYPVLETLLSHRITYQEAFAQGMSVGSTTPQQGGRGSAEVVSRTAGGTMKGKFDITGRTPRHTSPSPLDDAVDRFVSGAEPMTTMTVQIPERLKHALKQGIGWGRRR